MDETKLNEQLFHSIATGNLMAISQLMEGGRGKFSINISEMYAFLQFLKEDPPHAQVADLVKLLDDSDLLSRRDVAFRLIDVAVAKKNRALLVLAVELAADLDVETLLELASYSGLTAILKLALDKGVDLQQCLRESMGRLSFVEYILNYGKNANFVFDLNAEMMLANSNRDVKLVELLTRFGAAPLKRQPSLEGAMEGRRVNKDGYWIDPDPVTGRW